MKKRKLGQNGPELTEIGFGAWAIGGPWQFGWGPADDNQSVAAIQKALDSGINWIDTAAVYGLGHSEEIVAQAIKGRREGVFLATKCGLIWDNSGAVVKNLHPKSMRKEIEASLKRLQVDFIDLYQFHWPDKAHPVEKSWEEMVKFKEQGKIRYLGVSNFDIPLMQRCLKIHPIDSLQPPYSMLRRDIETEILPFCEAQGIGVVAYSPMHSGLLTGKYDPTKLSEGDWRKKRPLYQHPQVAHVFELIEQLKAIAEKYGKTVGQLAVAWVLRKKQVTSAIVGARTAQQVIENVNGSGWEVSSSDLDTIDNLLIQLEEKIGRNY